MKRLALILGLALAVAVMPGCGKREPARDEVIAAIRRTQRMSKQFTYEVDRRRSGADAPKNKYRMEKTVVRGLVEDDFRFRAQVDIAGKPAMEEIVSDDTLAVRFLEPSYLRRFVDKMPPPPEKLTTEMEGVTSLEALRSRRWVVDDAAAPVLVAGAPDPKNQETDPVLDAVTVFDYLEDSVNAASSVKRFDEDSLTPAYPSVEDPFPKPETGAKVVRYDLVRSRLPAVSASGGGGGGPGGGGEVPLPSMRHFRKMAIYIKDGRISEVRERIEVDGKTLDRFIGYSRAFMKERDIPKQFLDEFERNVRRLDRTELGYTLLENINVGLVAAGQPGINIRNMTLKLSRLGDPVKVDLPASGTDEVIKGHLLVLVSAGKPPAAAGEAGEGGAPAGAGGSGTEVTPPGAPEGEIEPGAPPAPAGGEAPAEPAVPPPA